MSDGSTLSHRVVVAWLRCYRNAPIQHADKLREQIRFATFQDHAHLPPEIAFDVGRLGRCQDSFFRQLAAGAEAAVKLIKVALRPVAEQLSMPRDAAVDQRVGGPIKSPRRGPGNWLEQLVNRNTETPGQLVQRAGMRMSDAESQAAKRSLVKLSGRHDLLKRQVVAGHNAAEVPGHSPGIAVDS